MEAPGPAISSATTDRNKHVNNQYKGRQSNYKGNGGGSGKHKGIHKPDGSVFTSHYDEWRKMSDKDRQTAIDAQVKNRANSGRDNKHQQSSDVSTNSIQRIKTKIK